MTCNNGTNLLDLIHAKKLSFLYQQVPREEKEHSTPPVLFRLNAVPPGLVNAIPAAHSLSESHSIRLNG